jgi:3-deoxy-D-manno-octulosonate 8-phosphate phosphatase (KDO 8-P phosphatase)
MMEKAKDVRMLILDVDGVLTDGTLYYTHTGEVSKAFNVRDGLGIRLLLHEAITVAIISGRRSKAVDYRARELGITEVHHGVSDKGATFDEIIARGNLSSGQVAFIGDDLIDLPLLARVGFSVAVADASEEVKAAADYVTRLPGGKGAVREVCELILKAQGKWKKWVTPGEASFPPLPIL